MFLIGVLMIQNNIKEINFSTIKRDFPILQQMNRGKPLIYLDSAASAQKPKAVIEAISHFYSHDYANIHRGVFELSERATDLYEAARERIRKFIHAKHSEEIVFVRGTTEGINLIAQTFALAKLQKGDEIIITDMEHHSNIVPWYLLQERFGVIVKVAPVTDEGAIDMIAYQKLLSPRTKMVALIHVSNVLGTINPIKDMIALAHQYQIPVLIDGAQAVPHLPVDVQELDCDFYVFSGHKLYGPTGIGVLYGKKHWLDRLPPYQGGGGMIESVTFAKITFAKAPQRFEAGTPDISGVIGLHAAINYIDRIGMPSIFAHELSLLEYAQTQLSAIPGVRIIGQAKPKIGVISFVVDNIHPHDLGTVLDHEGIAIRAGHHCAMPLMQRLQLPATARVSLGIYNDENDIAALCSGIQLAKRLFA